MKINYRIFIILLFLIESLIWSTACRKKAGIIITPSYDERLDNWRKGALVGDVGSMFAYGYAVCLRDPENIEGIEWIKKAAQAGSIEAKNYLAERNIN